MSPLSELEPRPRKLQGFKNIDQDVYVKEMSYLVSPADGRIAWAEAVKANRLDDSSIYPQSDKLRTKIRRIDGKTPISADVHAFLCAVALSKPVIPFDPDSLATVNDEYYQDGFGGCDYTASSRKKTYTAFGVFG